MPAQPTASSTGDGPTWAKVIDHTRCIGCHACTTACKSENQVPLSVTRTFVKQVDVGVFPRARRSFQVTRCNQCASAPCVAACPTAAMHARGDGIVDFDKSICIGCKACIAACPYDAIFINPEDHAAEKCNLCAHRLEGGLEPACVVVCPTRAIMVGDMNDPLSAVAQILHRDAVSVRRPEKETRPRLFYKGADQRTLDPLAARRPDGGLFMWSEQGSGPGHVPSGAAPGAAASSAAAMVSYDVPHKAPWDWRVSLYTVTKSVAAGAYLVPLLGALAGFMPWSSPAWLTVGPVLALVFLAATAALLVWDLEHPERFWMVLLKPQPRSWLVWGGFALTGFGGLLAVHLALALTGRGDLTRPLALVGGPLALATAVYTAFLFAQARARDLWQSSLLAPHLTVQALLAGSAALLVVHPPWAETPLAPLFAGTALVHVLMVMGEVLVDHPTAHARQAVENMTAGPWAAFFWVGVALAVVGGLAVLTPAAPAGAAAGLVGLFLYEHAYVQAGQSVPLA